MEDIITKFLTTIENKKENMELIYLYNDSIIKSRLTFNEQASESDKKGKKMNIIVIKIGEDVNKEAETISRDIICPICKENIFIDFDNFKISLHGCKNNHNINNISINQFLKIQKIDTNKIKCEKCSNYDDKNYICKKHKEVFINFCKSCNENLCKLCNDNHKNHDIFEFAKILIDKDDLIKVQEELKIIFDKYKINL